MHAVLNSTANAIDRDLPVRVASSLFHKFAAGSHNSSFSVRLWDGTEPVQSPNPRFTLVLCHPRALRTLLDSPDERTLGESFIAGDLDVEGDFEAALDFAGQLMSSNLGAWQKMALRQLAAILPAMSRVHGRDEELKGAVHSRKRDRAAVASHYDVSNDFYRLWLDRNMVYSEALFESPDEDLDTAQLHKLDHICRELRLQPGEHFLDIGCGWGGLILHAAAHYGVQATGITLSVQQAELARQRIAAAGLSDRVSVELRDYRDIDTPETYDKIASIGMVEHVGHSMLRRYFTQACRLLVPGGLFLLSGITASATMQREGASFIDHYVFPDGDLVPLHTMIAEAESCGLEVRDVENLREHYALTLDHWVHRLDEHADQARRATDELTYRTWKLYMAGSARGFRTGRVNLHQILLSKPDRGGCNLPLTRADWSSSTLIH